MASLNDLTRRISRKLQIQRGMHLTYDDLTLIVTTGAFDKLIGAAAKELEKQCLSHLKSQPEPDEPDARPSRNRFMSEAHSP